MLPGTFFNISHRLTRLPKQRILKKIITKKHVKRCIMLLLPRDWVLANAMASMAHAMGHTLGSIFHLPHGRAVSIFLPYTIEFTAQHAPQRITELTAVLGIQTPKGKAGQALASHIREVSREVGLPGNIADAGIDESEFISQLDKLVDDAFNDTQMITAARTPSFQELEQLFKYAYHGQPVDF